MVPVFTTILNRRAAVFLLALSAATFARAQEVQNRLCIPDQKVVPGQEDVWFPVVATHEQPLQAFQIVAQHDPEKLTLRECTQEWTATRTVQPELWVCNIFESHIELGCIVDFVLPYDGRALPAAPYNVLVQLVFDVAADVAEGTVTHVGLVNDSEVASLFNTFVVESRTRLPELCTSTVEVVAAENAARFFLRGDADASGAIELSDAVRVLNYLFRSGLAPPCLDAADFNDEGAVQINSAIAILTYLFRAGRPPAVPFPTPGLDGTDDDLPECD